MKRFIVAALAAGSVFGVYKLFQSPEKYLKKKTEYLISLSSIKNSKMDMAMISKVTKIAKFIHHNVQMKVEYKGQIFKASSLNEFRSYITAYFRQSSSAEALEYKNLTVQMKDNKKRGLVSFEIFFNRVNQRVFCKAALEWGQEKKWYVQKIDINSCQPLS